MPDYNHLEIEKKWQNFWETQKTFSVQNTPADTKNTKKFYALDMFPFPSGAGLHVGHPEGYTATDIICRKRRMEGYKVLHPMGWDAFGLPAENFAIKSKIHPEISTNKNIENFTRQIKSLGFSYDWDREISTTDTEYYKWTQDLFLKFYEKGLLYEDDKPMNWCPSCKVICANEEVEQGMHERCGNPVAKKALKQWMFKITDYAERLLQDLETPNVIVLHGLGGNGKAGWGADIQNFFTENNIACESPSFPDSDAPEYSEWKMFFEKNLLKKITPQTVLFAHSLGCGFLQRYLSEENVHVQCSEIVFVAPTVGDCDIPSIRNFFTQPFDYEKIKNTADTIVVYAGGKDPYITTQEFEFLAEKLSAQLVFDKNQEHYWGDVSLNTLPEISEKCEKIVAGTLDWPHKIKAMQKNWIGKSSGLLFTSPLITEYKKTYIQKKRGTKGAHPRKENSSDSIRFSQTTKRVERDPFTGGYSKDNSASSDSSVVSILLKNIPEVKKIRTRKKDHLFSIFQKINYQGDDIIFSGERIHIHFHNKNGRERNQRSSIVKTISSSFHLFYNVIGDEESFLFRIKNDIFRVVIEESKNIKYIKTFYRDNNLSKAYQHAKKTNTLEIQTYNSHFEAFCADTFFVIAPDHPQLEDFVTGVKNKDEILKTCKEIVARREARGFEEEKESEGVFTGRYIKDPVGNGKLPLWVASYALADYGTGIVKCSCHDERDFAFAKKYNIPLKPVLFPEDEQEAEKVKNLEYCYSDMQHGILTEPKEFAGQKAGGLRKKIATYAEENNFAIEETNYKLRDWIFTRQRYWGEPIPLIHCETCGTQSVSPLLKYQNEYFSTQKKGSVERHSNDAQREELQSKPLNTSNSVSILGNKILLCKEKTSNIFQDRKVFEKGEKNITTPSGKVFCNWKWIGTHFWKERRRNFYSRSKYQNIIIEILKNGSYQKDERGDDVCLGIKGEKIIKIILGKNEKGVFVKTFYIWKGFSKQIQKYLPKNALPLKLPDTPNYEPSATGESPLAKIADWVNVECPCCGKNAKRETSTMPNWAGSSWYWLRFMDAKNQNEAWSVESEKYWGSVDVYVGGAEHAVLHLLYARFWHKALYDMGLVSTKEPFKKLVNQGMILSYAFEKQTAGGGLVAVDEVETRVLDGEEKYFWKNHETGDEQEVKKITAKMSKSLKNVVNPDDIVHEFGADTLRMYEMFMGPFEQSKEWNTKAVEGMHKFLARIHRYFSQKEISESCPSKDLIVLTHKTVKKVSQDIEDFKFNTAISQMMVWMNEFSKLDTIPKIAGGKFVRLLAPFAPHLAEELWKKFKPDSQTITFENWPSYTEEFTIDSDITYGVQVNGKVRGELTISKDAEKNECLSKAKELEKVAKFINEAIASGAQMRKEIFVPGKIIGFVVK